MKLGPRTWQSALVSSALALTAFSVGAQSLDERLNKTLADPAALAAATTAARKVTLFCDGCHGGDGNSVIADVPNLAGQHPNYLLAQIAKFVNGERHFKFKEGLMKVLSDDDRINATIYYSTKTVKPAGKKGSAAGHNLYARWCAECHGGDGRGTETTPRVAGQQVQYLMQSMTRYRDRTGERIYAPMAVTTSGLKDQDIKALAMFMSSLH
jgi:cytochrome c553